MARFIHLIQTRWSHRLAHADAGRPKHGEEKMVMKMPALHKRGEDADEKEAAEQKPAHRV